MGVVLTTAKGSRTFVLCRLAWIRSACGDSSMPGAQALRGSQGRLVWAAWAPSAALVVSTGQRWASSVYRGTAADRGRYGQWARLGGVHNRAWAVGGQPAPRLYG